MLPEPPARAAGATARSSRRSCRRSSCSTASGRRRAGSTASSRVTSCAAGGRRVRRVRSISGSLAPQHESPWALDVRRRVRRSRSGKNSAGLTRRQARGPRLMGTLRDRCTCSQFRGAHAAHCGTCEPSRARVSPVSGALIKAPSRSHRSAVPLHTSLRSALLRCFPGSSAWLLRGVLRLLRGVVCALSYETVTALYCYYAAYQPPLGSRRS